MDDLIDAEWAWVTPFLADPDAPSATALRGYLNDRITERLVTARAEERERSLRETADAWQWGGWTVITAKVKSGSVLAVAQVVTEWLRARANRNDNGGEEV